MVMIEVFVIQQHLAYLPEQAYTLVSAWCAWYARVCRLLGVNSAGARPGEC